METTYETMTVEHLGQDATKDDLDVFQSLCKVYEHQYGTDAQVATDAIWGEGDYLRNARRLLGDRCVDGLTSFRAKHPLA